MHAGAKRRVCQRVNSEQRHAMQSLSGKVWVYHAGVLYCTVASMCNVAEHINCLMNGWLRGGYDI